MLELEVKLVVKVVINHLLLLLFLLLVTVIVCVCMLWKFHAFIWWQFIFIFVGKVLSVV